MEGMSQLSPGGTACSQQGKKMGMVALPALKIVINLPGKGLLVPGGAEMGGTLAKLVPISCSTLELAEGSSHSLLSWGSFPLPASPSRCLCSALRL